jgi:serine/threonine-protein kinase RsbW
MSVTIKIELCLPRDVATVPLVRHMLRHTLQEYGVTADCAADVCLALSEAAANVVEHTDGDDVYEVSVAVEDDRCNIRVIDVGTGFDHVALADGAASDHLAERGRGIALMKALVDRAEFESVPEQGTVVHLVKALAFDVGPLGRPS